MELRDPESLKQFAREHHVHYEVEPETVEGAPPEVVAFEVRLFATQGESRLDEPKGERSVELLDELRSFAEQLVRADEAAGRTEVLPTILPALYRSTEVPDADEVALTVRARCEAPEHRTGVEDRCLADLRHRLEALGVPRR